MIEILPLIDSISEFDPDEFIIPDLTDSDIPSIWPSSGTVTSEFGEVRLTHIHKGIDISNNTGTPIRSTANGTVIAVGSSGNFGRRIMIYHGTDENGTTYVTIYAHLSDFSVGIGEKVDQEISKLLLGMLNPLAIKAAIEVQNELSQRKLETDKFYRQQVERAKYDMEIAKKRYMLVDPQNHLVATELEAAWNQKLRQLEKTRQEYEKKKEDDLKEVRQTTKADIIRIASDFPRLWSSPNIAFREKKRMIRLLIEDVTVKNDDKKVILNIRFRAATSKTLVIDRKLPIYKIRKTKDEIIAKVDELTENHIPSEIAATLNQQDYRLWGGNTFKRKSVKYIIRTYGLNSRYERLRGKGYLTLREKMTELNSTQKQIMQMRNEDKIVFHRATKKNEYLYEPQNMNKYLVKTQS